MLRREEKLGRAPMPRLSVWLACVLASMAPAPTEADLDGHWRATIAIINPEPGVHVTVTDIVQSGRSVSFVLDNGVAQSFSGIVRGTSFTATSPAPECGLNITGIVAGDERSISGTLVTVLPCSFAGDASITLNRCQCFDGNDNNGDGCDAGCRVETCYACTGEPSVCTPEPDGTPCDDRTACTTGEICGAGSCGGGSPAPHCVAADFSGPWRVRWGHFTRLIEIAQVEATVSFALPDELGTDVSFSGTALSGDRGFVAASTSTPGGCDRTVGVFRDANDGALEGVIIARNASCPSGQGQQPMRLERCACFDGNTDGGDGCDGSCHVESCYDCSGIPSVCSPLPDGGTCDDRNACTSGETCAAGICGGGGPVSPCIDLSGSWSFNGMHVAITQRNTELETVGAIGSTVTSILTGAIDPSTGTFYLAGNYDPLCSNLVAVTGEAALDGLTLTGLQTSVFRTQCYGVNAVITGTRCGGGTREASEECDDGNIANGDGCDATCHVEPCFACSGSTSVCVGAPRTGCLASTVAPRTSLAIVHAGMPERDSFAWHWHRGAQSNMPSLGDPTQSTSYALCVYDESTSPPTVLMSRSASHGSCSTQCWRQRSHGFSFRSNVDGNASRIELRVRPDGPAKVLVRGTGIDVRPPRAPLSLPLRVQLQAVDSSDPGLRTCFEAQYGKPGVHTNADGVFRARTTGP